MRSRSLALPIALALGSVSCAEGKLLPAASAHVIAGAPETATAERDGVRVSADGDDWSASPADLPQRLTPVKVRILNHSGSPVLVEYRQFVLVGAHGRVYRAIPPVSLDHAQGSDGTIEPVYAASNFFVGPRFHDVYPTLAAWSQPLDREGDTSAERYQLWGHDLPTRSIRRMGLPEGVLADGGEISGFLYFENATKRESRLTFRADIDGAQDGGQLTKIELPFRVQ
ncbi:MAG TPA: hypothetical protein VGP64_17365 [Polyangia bacterium]|jgi:hypothetical protein